MPLRFRLLATLLLTTLLFLTASPAAWAEPAPTPPRRINWWRVAGWSAVGVGGGFIAVGLGHEIAARLDVGDLERKDTAGKINMQARVDAETRIRKLQNGAFLNLALGGGVALAGMIILLLKPARPAVAPAATPTLSFSPMGVGVRF